MSAELARIGKPPETPNRLSVQEDEFKAGAAYYEVFLNGMLISNAVRADRKEGFVDVIRSDAKGQPIMMYDGVNPQTERKFGVVQFVLKGDL